MKSLKDIAWNGSVDQYLKFKITSPAFVANGESCLFLIENPHTILKLLPVVVAVETLFLTFDKDLSTSFSELKSHSNMSAVQT